MRKLQNILVTGGAGFIGSNFINCLFNNSFSGISIFENNEFTGNVINVDSLTYAGNLENLKTVDEKFGSGVDFRASMAMTNEKRRYFFEKVDITNRTEIERIFKQYNIDTVVHFAAETHVDRSIDTPETFLTTNVMGTFTLLDVAKNYWKVDLEHKRDDVLFHHISTDEVYGTLGKEGLFTEKSNYDPKSPYSASKAGADFFVMSYANTYGLPVTVSNCSNNFGPAQYPEKLIPLVISRIINNKPVPVYGDGLNIRDWLYVEDHAKGIWHILNYGKEAAKYNIGGENELNNLELINQIISIVAFKLNKSETELKTLIQFTKDRPGHDRRYAIDCSKIKEELNWKRNLPFNKALELTVDWYLKNLSTNNL